MNIKQAKHIHFTGIKGVGMTAVALCADDLGIGVSGSDLAEEFVTDSVLSERNIKISNNFEVSQIPPEADLLVYTGAHKGEANPQVIAARNKNIRTISQAHALAELMEGKSGISVCGVGGKSTTSAMIATILSHANLNPSYVVGVGNIYPLGAPGKFDREGKYFVAEADEYAVAPGTDNTPKFMLQHPDIVVCTNIAHDHPDIYKTIDDTLEVYRQFFSRLNSNQTLVINADDSHTENLIQNLNCRVITYSHTARSDYQIIESTIQNARQTFTVHHKDGELDLSLQIPGAYNQSNALAAFIVSHVCGVGQDIASKGLLSFSSTKRRFEFIGTKNEINYYDDYAHHPSEISAVLKAAKSWFPGKRIVAVFQPHTYSRTKSLLQEFSQSFVDADTTIITPIFASAREGVDSSISSEILVERIRANSVKAEHAQSFAEVVEYLSKHTMAGDIIITIGAGDIYKLHKMI